MVLLSNLVDSRAGRALRAIHGAEDAARAMGVDTAGFKLRTFVLSAAFAAVAGVFLTHFNGGIGPSEASIMKSVKYVAIVAVGGMGSLWGTLATGLVLNFLSLRGYFGTLDDAVFGAILIADDALRARRARRAAPEARAKGPRRRARRPPHGARLMPLLEVRSVSKSFGGLHAVHDVSFRVEQGMIKAIIGPNGAGKTTLFNMVSGFVRPDQGYVRFDGQAIEGKAPHQVAACGISRTFQHIRLFAQMSALENVMVGRHLRSRAGFVAGMLHLPWSRREQAEARASALELMEFLGIAALADAEATSLAYGQQRAVELARALACEPRMLLLDEPAAGLNMRETADLAKLIGRIRDRGVTVLLVEHDMSLVMGISDEVVVLSYGEKIADADPLSVQKDPQVMKVYLGEEEC